jgi:hypothetical protein
MSGRPEAPGQQDVEHEAEWVDLGHGAAPVDMPGR